MKYEIKDYNSYTVNLCNIKRFKNIDIILQIRETIKKEEITIRKILFNVLLHSSKKYNSPKDITIELEDLYSAILDTRTYRTGNFICSELIVSALEDKYTEENNFNKVIELLSELLFNPKIENNSFDDKIVDLYKEKIKNQLTNLKDFPPQYAAYKGITLHDPNSVTSYTMYGYLEDLENINGKTLYDYYKKILKTNLFDFYVVGNITMNKISSSLKKYFSNINIISRKNNKIFVNDKIIKKTKIDQEKTNFNQSIIRMYYKFDNIKTNEKIYNARMCSLVLGGGIGLLFNKVREKYSLCYSIGSYYNYYDNILIIETKISKENYQKTIRLIKETIKDIIKMKYSDQILEDKKNIIINQIDNVDNNQYQLKDFMFTLNTLKIDDVETIKNNIKKINKNDISKIAKKLKLESIFYLEGDNNEEK